MNSIIATIYLCIDERDFNASVLVVKFPADENNPMAEIEAPIPVFDDDVDEVESQFFYVVLEIANATNPGLVETDHKQRNLNVTLCNIRDNDGKF